MCIRDRSEGGAGRAARALGGNRVEENLHRHHRAVDIEGAGEPVSYTHLDVHKRQTLNQLASALFPPQVPFHSAHVATYGERAVDTFYVTDLIGDKIDSAARVKSLEKRLLEAATSQSEEAVAA